MMEIMMITEYAQNQALATHPHFPQGHESSTVKRFVHKVSDACNTQVINQFDSRLMQRGHKISTVAYA